MRNLSRFLWLHATQREDRGGDEEGGYLHSGGILHLMLSPPVKAGAQCRRSPENSATLCYVVQQPCARELMRRKIWREGTSISKSSQILSTSAESVTPSAPCSSPVDRATSTSSPYSSIAAIIPLTSLSHELIALPSATNGRVSTFSIVLKCCMNFRDYLVHILLQIEPQHKVTEI